MSVFRKRSFFAYLFVFPALVVLLTFVYFPAFYSFYLSFTNYNLLSRHYSFVGFENYWKLLHDPLFLDSLKHTAIYTAGVVPIQTLVALGLGLVYSSSNRFVKLMRALVFVPAITSSVIVSLIFIWIFSPSGFVNSVLSLFGVKPENWLIVPSAALPAIMSVAIWGTSAYFMVVFIAGINSIPENLYEASLIDGAKSAWQRFRYITLPLLKPSVFIATVLGMIGALQIFDLSYVMTNGGPGYATYTALLYIYDYAFSYNEMGYAAAASFLLFVLIFVVSLILRRYLEVKRWY
jgi:multiple sugar transport system permease protein